MKPTTVAIAATAILALLVLGVGGVFSSRFAIHHSSAATPLRRDAVPNWAEQPLRQAARTCPEITAPLLAAQIDTESAWNRTARNHQSGAQGLAQFLPGTWQEYKVDGNRDGVADPMHAADAIPTQAHYMCELINFVRSHPELRSDTVDLALAAYNAGPARLLEYRGIPPFPETATYIADIHQKTRRYASANNTSGGPVHGAASPVIQAARHQKGTPYAWGGGTLTGPSTGQYPDTGTIGFDCSSLVRYAYYQGTRARITLPRTSAAQYQATADHPVADNKLRPGDLLFWGSTPASIHHVAVYTGNGHMIEAPQSGQTIHETRIRMNNDYLGATRVLN